MITIQELQEIIKLVSLSPIQKFEFSNDTWKVLIEKNSSVKSGIEDKTENDEPKAASLLQTVSGNTLDKEDSTNSKESGFHEIVSPMVGTFYCSSQQGGAPYAQIGDKVHPDTVICVLEAMKLFTDITAKVSGVIVEILVNNGELVEYGQPLFRVRLD